MDRDTVTTKHPTIEITSIGMAAYLIVHGHDIRTAVVGGKVTWYVDLTKAVQDTMNAYPGSIEGTFQRQVLTLKKDFSRIIRQRD